MNSASQRLYLFTFFWQSQGPWGKIWKTPTARWAVNISNTPSLGRCMKALMLLGAFCIKYRLYIQTSMLLQKFVLRFALFMSFFCVLSSFEAKIIRCPYKQYKLMCLCNDSVNNFFPHFLHSTRDSLSRP